MGFSEESCIGTFLEVPASTPSIPDGAAFPPAEADPAGDISVTPFPASGLDWRDRNGEQGTPPVPAPLLPVSLGSSDT